jgi:hypothetical protein
MTILTQMILASFWTSDGVVRISRYLDHHSHIIGCVLCAVVLALVPNSWKKWSERFERKHQRLLWILVAVMFLLIPIVFWMER